MRVLIELRLISLVFLLVTSHLKAQQASIGYLGHWGYQPGAKISYYHQLENDFQISPQVGFFSRSGFNNNWLINLEVGRRFHKEEKRRYTVIGIAAGYWRQAEEIGFTINLGTGNTTAEDIEIRNYFIPALTHEQGWKYDKWTPYFKNSLGMRYGNGGSTLAYFLEIGVKMKFGPNG